MLKCTTIHYFVRDFFSFSKTLERLKWRRVVGRRRKEYFWIGGAWEGKKKLPSPHLHHDLNGKWLARTAQIVAWIHSPNRL